MRGWHTHTASPLHSEPMPRSRRNLNRSPPKGTCWPADRIPARAEHMPPLPGHGLVPTAPVRSARRARVRCGAPHRCTGRRRAAHAVCVAPRAMCTCERGAGCRFAPACGRAGVATKPVSCVAGARSNDSAVRARRGRRGHGRRREGGGGGGRRCGRARCGTVRLAAAVRCGASAVHTGPWPTPHASIGAKKFNTK